MTFQLKTTMFSLVLVLLWGRSMPSVESKEEGKALQGCVFHGHDTKYHGLISSRITLDMCTHLFITNWKNANETILKKLCNMKHIQYDLKIVVGDDCKTVADVEKLLHWSKSLSCELDGVTLSISSTQDMPDLSMISKFLKDQQLEVYISMYAKPEMITEDRQVLMNYNLANLVDGVLAYGSQIDLVTLGKQIIPVPPAIQTQRQNKSYSLEDIIDFWKSLDVPSNLIIGEIPHVQSFLYVRENPGEKDPIGTKYTYKSTFNPAVTCLDKNMKKIINKTGGYGYSYNRTHMSGEIFPEIAELFAKRMSAEGFKGFVSHTFSFEVHDDRCGRRPFGVMKAANQAFTGGPSLRDLHPNP